MLSHVFTGLTRIYSTESVFLDLLRRPEIDSQPGGIGSSESIHGLNKRSLYSLHLLAVAEKMNIVPFKGRHCPGKVVAHHHKPNIFKPEE
jgi:hypothetical protein